MKLFSNTLLAWQEPAAYTYGSSKNRWLGYGSSNNRWVGLLFPITVIALAVVKQTPWWIILGLIPLVTAIGLLPWMHSRWPSLFPLTGPRVTLYDDRIARQTGKSQISIALDNIAECRITTRDGDYSVLSFMPKSTGIFSVLTETAVSDSAVTKQVIAYLRGKGITVTEVNDRHTSP